MSTKHVLWHLVGQIVVKHVASCCGCCTEILLKYTLIILTILLHVK